MKRINASLLKQILACLVFFVTCSGFLTNALADNTLSNAECHAGASGLVSQLLDNQNASDPDMAAGAALYLQGGDGVLLADAQKEQQSDMEEQTPVLNAELKEPSNVVMANVKESVNVREEADEEAKTVGKLFTNCGGTILERKNGWTLLESGEVKGWTKDEYLLFGEEAEQLRQEVGYYKATAKTDGLRVRKEADVEAGVYEVLAQNDTLRVKEQNDEWVVVQYDKDMVGYVSAEYVDVTFYIPEGKTISQIEKEEKAKEEKKKAAEKKKATEKKNRGAVAVGGNDVTLLAALIQCEAGRESYEGKLAVGAVVMNRVRSASYPGSISAVITAPSQFPPATNGKVAAVLAKGPSAACIQAAQEAIAGASNIGGATHFRAARSGASGIVIGNHVFW